jgi:NitT/TauT family transport system substrate-binding protein
MAFASRHCGRSEAMTAKNMSRLCCALLVAAAVFSTPALAADKFRAGKTIGVLWALTPVDIGVEEGIFAKYGLDVEITTLTGDTKLQQALISDSVDVGLAGGTGMVFAVKGSPVLGVAALAGAPRNFSIIVGPTSTIRSVKDLHNKLLGVSTVGSLVEWFAKHISTREGWGIDGIKTVATGGFEGTLAALKTGQIDGFTGATELGYQLEEKHEGKIIAGMEEFVPRFHTQVILAQQKVIHEQPALLDRFLKGMFASVAFMKHNREKTIEITSRVMHMSPAVIAKTYDYEIAMLSDDGAFDAASLTVLKDSYRDMGLLPEAPTDAQILTRQFVPVKF